MTNLQAKLAKLLGEAAPDNKPKGEKESLEAKKVTTRKKVGKKPTEKKTEIEPIPTVPSSTSKKFLKKKERRKRLK